MNLHKIAEVNDEKPVVFITLYYLRSLYLYLGNPPFLTLIPETLVMPLIPKALVAPFVPAALDFSTSCKSFLVYTLTWNAVSRVCFFFYQSLFHRD